MELEEPIRRTELTSYERSKTLVRLAETARQRAQHELPTDEFRPTVRRNTRGRPPQPGSYRAVERRTGLPRETVRRAVRHVEAAERYAELQAPDIPQAEAIAIAKTLDRLPEEARAVQLSALRARRPGILAELRGTPLRPPSPPAAEATGAWAGADPLQGWQPIARQIGVFLSRVEAAGGLEAVTRAWHPDGREALLADMDQAIAQLAWLRTALRRLIDA